MTTVLAWWGAVSLTATIAVAAWLVVSERRCQRERSARDRAWRDLARQLEREDPS